MTFKLGLCEGTFQAGIYKYNFGLTCLQQDTTHVLSLRI